MAERAGFRRTALGLVTAWLTLFVAVPLVLVAAASLMTRGETGELFHFGLSLENYARFLDPVYAQVFLDSFLLAGSTSLACLLIGYPFAYILARHSGRRKHLMLLCVIIPFWTSSLIRTYALMILLKANGVLNLLLAWAGLTDAPLKLLYTDGAVLLGLTYALLPFMILPLYAQLEKLDPRLLEAAADLGAGRTRSFLSITLPLSLPGVLAGVMLTFLPALGMFYIPDLLGGAKTVLLGNLIKNQFLTARDWPFGSAASMLLMGLMLALLAVYVLLTRRNPGRTASGDLRREAKR